MILQRIIMDKRLLKNLKELDELNKQRKNWLRLSLGVIVGILLVVFNWDYIKQSHLTFVVFVLGSAVSVVWWYWTINSLKKFINFKSVETELLSEIIQEIKYIKKNINQKP